MGAGSDQGYHQQLLVSIFLQWDDSQPSQTWLPVLPCLPVKGISILKHKTWLMAATLYYLLLAILISVRPPSYSNLATDFTNGGVIPTWWELVNKWGTVWSQNNSDIRPGHRYTILPSPHLHYPVYLGYLILYLLNFNKTNIYSLSLIITKI